MSKIRVLVVDDSVVIRRLLTEILAQDPAIEVVGTAPNGRIALAKLPQLSPDLVTLDIEMPDMDGLETLAELRKAYPALPVIMFSTLTEHGAVATIDALARGATDYVAKPANVGSVSAGMQSIKDQLIPKIKSLCIKKVPAPAAGDALMPAFVSAKPRPVPRGQRCEVILIGCSTGGPTALATVLKHLPGNLPVGVLIVQHMPPVFTRHLAARLNQECALEVAEAAGGETVQPGKVLIAPGDFHLEVHRQGLLVKTVVQQGPPENSCRPAVDVLFRSAADAYGGGCLAAILTGMGQDGLRGARQIAAAGGTVIAQDQSSCVVWGMPRAVEEAGLAHHVLPLRAIPAELVRLATDRSRKLVTC